VSLRNTYRPQSKSSTHLAVKRFDRAQHCRLHVDRKSARIFGVPYTMWVSLAGASKDILPSSHGLGHVRQSAAATGMPDAVRVVYMLSGGWPWPKTRALSFQRLMGEFVEDRVHTRDFYLIRGIWLSDSHGDLRDRPCSADRKFMDQQLASPGKRAQSPGVRPQLLDTTSGGV
jgi:hypothetical protein